MILGIGTDIVSTARIEAASARHGAAFAARILSPQELAELPSVHPERFLSKRFAAKEAFSKATGYGLREPVSMRRITVSHDGLGKPLFLFDEVLAAHLKRLGVTRHHLSLSDERDTAVAFVILEGEG